MQTLLTVLTMFVIAGAIVAVVQLLFVRPADRSATAEVQRWAEREGLRIVSCERLFLGGSFLFDASRYQRVFKVTVLRPDGRTAAADVRVGDYWRGMRGPRREPDVRWRDQWGYPAL